MIKLKREPDSQSPQIPGLWVFWLLPIVIFGYLIFSLSSRQMWQQWLKSEGSQVLSWWALTTLAGIAAFPLLFRLLPGLADHGYALARTAGLMLVGSVFWFLASMGFLRNNPGAMMLSWLLVLGAGIIAWLKWQDRPSWSEFKTWIVNQLALIVVTEALFFVTFFAWAYFKAHNPELTSTEKPMEMAFINGVRNSATFPPKDPWLAGYAISYYYFGYVLVAGLADLSGIATGMAFNLADALLFALTATGAFGVTYNLVCSAGNLQRWRVGGRNAALGTGLLAATLTVLAGNLGTALIEMPYRGYAASIPILKNIVTDGYFDFWDNEYRSGPYYTTIHLDDGTSVYYLLDKEQALAPGSPVPQGYRNIPDADHDGIADWDDTDNTSDIVVCHDENKDNDIPQCNNKRLSVVKGRGEWWWWPYSRVVRDRELGGTPIGAQPIAEVPQFSFILSDNHPHVLALPFVFLVIGLAVSLAFRREALYFWEIGVYGIIIGGLIFANAWDAVFLLVVVAAETLRRLLCNGTGRLSGWDKFVRVVTLQEDTERFVLLVGPVFAGILVFFLWRDIGSLEGTYGLISFAFQIMVAAIATVPATLAINWLLDDNDWAGVVRLGLLLVIVFYAFYLPWITSFSSQASGFYPNVVYPTRSQQFFLQFGLFVLLIVPFIVMEVVRAGPRINWVMVSTIVSMGLFVLFAVPVVSAVFINWQCPIGGDKPGQVERFAQWACSARDGLFGGYDSQTSLTLAADVVRRRLQSLPSQLMVLLVIGIIFARFFPRQSGWPVQKRYDNELLNFSPNTAIALLIIGAGALAALMPDFIFLRDNFSTRINTVFKLYYQAWVLLSVGTAYAVYAVLSGTKGLRVVTLPPLTVDKLAWRGLYGIGAAFLLIAALLYPYFGIVHRAIYDSDRDAARTCIPREGFECPREQALTLDGSPTFIQAGRGSIISADEYKAMQCLARREPRQNDAVLVEAWGGAYTPELGRFSMYTGIPTLLGWDNHERQWRGEPEYAEKFEGNQRQIDIDQLYRLSAEQWTQVQQIINRYGIDYIVVGDAERYKYRNPQSGEPVPELNKFAQLLDPVCQEGSIAVYRVSTQ